MVDSIKDSLKLRRKVVVNTKDNSLTTRTQTSPRNQTGDPMRIGRTRTDVLPYLGGSTAVNVNPRMEDVNYIIKGIDKGQQELERYVEYREARPLKKTMLDVKYYFADKIVRQPINRRDLHQIFPEQQERVRQLNSILDSMVESYSSKLDEVKGTLDTLIPENRDETLRKKFLEEEVPKQVYNEKSLQETLQGLDPDADPEKHSDALQQYMKVVREKSDTTGEFFNSAMSVTHIRQRIWNIWLSERLFAAVIEGAQRMSTLTSFYQEHLDDLAGSVEPVVELSDMMSIVSTGIGMLQQYQDDLNASYSSALENIRDTIQSHPGLDAADRQNAVMAQLLGDVQRANLTDSMRYLS